MAASSSVIQPTDSAEAPRPPATNRGVTVDKLVHFPPAFDWYSATVFRSHKQVVEQLRQVLDATAHTMDRPLPGYRDGVQLRRDDRRVAAVYGRPDETHIVGTGSDSPEVAAAVRRFYPDHRLTRADIAYDFLGGTDTWDHASSLLLDLAGDLDIHQRLYIDPIRIGREGRTHYLGAASSEVRMRLYEKALQAPHDYPDGTNRCEVQVRPKTPARKVFTAMSEPAAIAGYTAWSRAALAAIFGEELDSLPPRTARLGDDDQAVVQMLKQYGHVLARWTAVNGWEPLQQVVASIG